jgi:hypothetical protein
MVAIGIIATILLGAVSITSILTLAYCFKSKCKEPARNKANKK